MRDIWLDDYPDSLQETWERLYGANPLVPADDELDTDQLVYELDNSLEFVYT